MSNQGAQPKTWLSDESVPGASKDIKDYLPWIGIAFAAITPLTVATAFLCYLLFSKVRISHRVIAAISSVLLIILLVSKTLVRSIVQYPQTIAHLVDSFASQSMSAGVIIEVLAHQAPASVALGLILGTSYCAWRWFRRPAWEEFEFRLSPVQWYLKRKRIDNMRNDRKSPKDGARLGITRDGVEIIQSDKEAAAHTLYFGAAGAGKTTTMATQIRDHIRRGHGTIIIDLKGSPEFAEIAAEYAQRYGRRFQHWTMHDPRMPYTGPAENGLSFYDPLGRGDASRRKDMVINMRKWTEDYYKSLASSYLQVAFEVMIASPHPDGLDAMSDIINLLNEPEQLVKRSYAMPDDDYHNTVRKYIHGWTGGLDERSGRMRRKLQPNEASAIGGISSDLQNIKGSTAGHWLRKDADSEMNIDILRAAHRGDVIVFTLDALMYPKAAPLVANLIIEDLKTVTSDLMSQQAPHPLHVFIDEFSAIDSEGITGLINKSRSAGMPVTLATQALGDLRRVDETFLDQLLGICNAFVIHRANTFADAEILAGLVGKEMKWNVRLGVEHSSGFLGMMGRGAATGAGMVDRVEDFIVPPSDIQNLGAGEIIYLAKSPKQRIEHVTVIPERTNITSDGTSVRGDSTAANAPRMYMPPPMMPQTEEIVPTPEYMPPAAPAAVARPQVVSPAQAPVPAPVQTYEQAPVAPVTVQKAAEVPPAPLRPSSGFLEGRDLRASMGSRPTPQRTATAPVPASAPTFATTPTGTPARLPRAVPLAPPKPAAPPHPQRNAALPLPKKPVAANTTPKKPSVPGAPKVVTDSGPAQPSSEWDDERW